MTYKTGEITLSKIGKEFGNITPTMINKILDNGLSKVKLLLGVKEFEEIDFSLFDQQSKKIEEIRIKTSDVFIKHLILSKNTDEFLASLKKERLLTKLDIDSISKEEKGALEVLKDYDVELSRQMLLEDIENEENLFKSFQTAVSRAVFKSRRLYGKS